jgi:hypothetical protein
MPKSIPQNLAQSRSLVQKAASADRCKSGTITGKPPKKGQK